MAALADIDGTVAVGGDFWFAGGQVSQKWARWVPDWGDLNGDGVLDLDDIGQFVTCSAGPGLAYAAGCDCADVDGDRDVDLVDFGWVQVFWEAP